MKKLFYSFTLAAGLCTLSFAQDAKTTANAAASTADIKMDKTEHDYGTIKQGENGDCEFRFINNGKEPLVINNCQQSCGCTIPACPKEPILPGKSGIIKVHYDTNRTGPFMKTVAVSSNAKSGTITLSIKGNVEPKPSEVAFPENKSASGAPVEKKSAH